MSKQPPKNFPLFPSRQPKLCPSFEEQIGWTRTHPKEICQDRDVLMRCKIFCFNVDDTGFLQYFRSRRGSHLFECEKPELARKSLFMSKDRRWCIERGQLQNIWELYVKYVCPEAVPVLPFTVSDQKQNTPPSGHKNATKPRHLDGSTEGGILASFK